MKRGSCDCISISLAQLSSTKNTQVNHTVSGWSDKPFQQRLGIVDQFLLSTPGSLRCSSLAMAENHSLEDSLKEKKDNPQTYTHQESQHTISSNTLPTMDLADEQLATAEPSKSVTQTTAPSTIATSTPPTGNNLEIHRRKFDTEEEDGNKHYGAFEVKDYHLVLEGSLCRDCRKINFNRMFAPRWDTYSLLGSFINYGKEVSYLPVKTCLERVNAICTFCQMIGNMINCSETSQGLQTPKSYKLTSCTASTVGADLETHPWDCPFPHTVDTILALKEYQTGLSFPHVTYPDPNQLYLQLTSE